MIKLYYFKCKFCREQMSCVTRAYSDGSQCGPLCAYSTGYSIFKWVLRILVLVPTFILPGYGFYWSIYALYHAPSRAKQFSAYFILFLLSVIFTIMLVTFIRSTLERFWAKGGAIWVKERRNR